jgi:hypothetical protein
VTDSGGIAEDSEEKLRDDELIFRLDPSRGSGDTKEHPMWCPQSQRSLDWYFSEE